MKQLIAILLLGWGSCIWSTAFAGSTETAELKAQLNEEQIAMSKIRVQRSLLDEDETKSVYQFKQAQRIAVLDEYRIRRQLYERQLYYHPIILITVVLIVLAGIIFCAFQVWRDFRFGGNSATTFKISRDGLELSSSVVGLISLGLSFIFFYCYVTAIYQLANTDEISATKKESAETQHSTEQRVRSN